MQHNVISTPHGRCIPGDPEIVRLVSRPEVLATNTRQHPRCATPARTAQPCLKVQRTGALVAAGMMFRCVVEEWRGATARRAGPP